MKKKCLNCGESFNARPHQLYCSSRCKGQFNYNRNKRGNAYTMQVDNILHKNRLILKSLLGQAKSTIIFRVNLTAIGFNLSYFTEISKSSYDNRIYYYCYEYGYAAVDNERFLILKKKELTI